MLLRMARIDPDPADSIVSGAKWTLKERVGALFEDKAGLLLLRSSLVIAAQASDGGKAGELVRDLLERLLRFWREEEDLKEEKKAEAEAMYKTRTECPDGDEEAEAEAEYRKLFPTFTDMFSDLVEEDQLSDITKDVKVVAKANTADSTNQLYSIVVLLQKFLLKKKFTEAELQTAVETQLTQLIKENKTRYNLPIYVIFVFLKALLESFFSSDLK